MAKDYGFDLKLAAHLVKCQRAFAAKPTCLIDWVGECKEKAIKSHLVSRSALNSISESGHVTNYGYDLFRVADNPDPIFKPIGVGKASTFKGFCVKHDTEIFAPIDHNNFVFDESIAATIALRAFANEVWQKGSVHSQLSSYDLLNANFEKDETQARIVDSVSLGVRDFLIQYHSAASEALIGDAKNWKYIHMMAPFQLPFAYSGPLNVDVFPQYNKNNPNPENVYPAITISVIPRPKATSISVIWKGIPTSGMKVLFKRFQYAHVNMSEFLLQLGLEHVEKIYFKPTWFDAAYAKYFDEIIQLTHQNTRETQYNWISINKRPLHGIFDRPSVRLWPMKTNSNYARSIIRELKN